MKKTLIFSLLTLVNLVAFSQSEKSNFKKYPFKSVIIEYKIEGKTTGTKTVYIEDYGYKESIYSKTLTKMMGVKTEEDKAEIMIGDVFYSVDFKTGDATSSLSPIAQFLATTDDDWKDNNENLLQQMGFTKFGTENIDGKVCDVWKGMNTVWIWKGLVLKSETKMLGMKFTEISTDIKINASIPADKFEVPKEMEVQENAMGSEMQDFMNGYQEEMKDIKKNYKTVSYEQYRASVLEDDPNTPEEDIKKSYELYKKMMK